MRTLFFVSLLLLCACERRINASSSDIAACNIVAPLPQSKGLSFQYKGDSASVSLQISFVGKNVIAYTGRLVLAGDCEEDFNGRAQSQKGADPEIRDDASGTAFACMEYKTEQVRSLTLCLNLEDSSTLHITVPPCCGTDAPRHFLLTRTP